MSDSESEYRPPSPEQLADMADAVAKPGSGPANDPAPFVVPESAAVCPNCFYSHEFKPRRYECRRFPPTPILFGFAPPALEGQQPQPVINALFPQMALMSTCGEFTHRDPKKAA